MSSELDNVARSLYNGHIPGIWRRLAPATLKTLGNWMIHFQQRYDQYYQWVTRSFCFLVFMPPPDTDKCVGGIMLSGCVSLSASVRSYVRACVPKSFLARYLKNQWMEFHQTLVNNNNNNNNKRISLNVT